MFVIDTALSLRWDVETKELFPNFEINLEFGGNII